MASGDPSEDGQLYAHVHRGKLKDADCADDARAVILERIVPELREREGYRGIHVLYDPETLVSHVISFWAYCDPKDPYTMALAYLLPFMNGDPPEHNHFLVSVQDFRAG